MKEAEVDLLLIMPPNNFSDMIQVSEDVKSAYYVHYPHLGLLYLASACEQAGYRVAVVDALVEHLSIDAVVNRIAEQKPRFVGITVTTPTLRVCFKLCQRIQLLTDTPVIVLGGPHISADPEIVKLFPYCFGLRGEADESFPALLKEIDLGGSQEDVPGIVIHQPQGFFTSPLSVPPKKAHFLFPARHLVPNKMYRNPANALSTTSAITVRGCPFDCAFCSRAVRGSAITFGEVEHSLAEMKMIREKFGLEYVTIMDETFTFSRKHVFAFCEGILERGIDLQWGCQTRADLVDREMLSLMRRAGCRLISCGVESGSPRLRKLLGKPVAKDIYFRFVRLCQESKLETNAFWIFGHPTETLPEMEDTLQMCVRLGSTYASFNITNIFAGSPLYAQLVQEGIIDRTIWDDYVQGRRDLPILVPEGMDENFLRSKIAEGFRRFYLRPQPFLQRVKKWKDWRELAHDIRIFTVLAAHYMRRGRAA